MAAPLDEVQIAEIRELFTLLDKNSDGLVSTTQLGMILRGLRYNPSDNEVFELQKKIDPNNTTSFDQNSLISLVGKIDIKNNTVEELLQAIKAIKPDEHNPITCSQLISRMIKDGETMSEGEIADVIRDLGMDPDHDEIHEEEFIKMLYNK